MTGRFAVGARILCGVMMAIGSAAAAAPVLQEIPDQAVREGLLFASIVLSDLVEDPAYPFELLTWSFTGNVELTPVPYLDRVAIRIPDPEWSGSETIRFEVCNPVGECASREATFSVYAVNDPPTIARIADQIVRVGEPFEPVDLSALVSDLDDETSDLVWSVERQGALVAAADGGSLRVAAPSVDWIGSETLLVRACDPAGGCAERAVVFARVDDRSIAIRLIHNDGFTIEAAGVRVVIDALVAQGAEPELQRAMRAAAPPFDVDLILITHGHSDHFSAAIVADHLRANPDAVVVSTPDVVERIAAAAPEIEAARLRSVVLGDDGSALVEAGGVAVVAYDVPHGGATANLGFVVRLGPWTVFHSGDVADVLAREVFVRHRFAEAGIDVALVPYFLLTMPAYQPALLDGIRAGLYVPMHIASGFARTCESATAAFANVLCFDGPMDVWVGFPDAD